MKYGKFIAQIVNKKTKHPVGNFVTTDDPRYIDSWRVGAEAALLATGKDKDFEVIIMEPHAM